MSDPEDAAWERVAAECPRQVDALLHRAGYHLHLFDPAAGGLVLCFRLGTPLPAGLEHTEAQLAAWQAANAG